MPYSLTLDESFKRSLIDVNTIRPRPELNLSTAEEITAYKQFVYKCKEQQLLKLAADIPALIQGLIIKDEKINYALDKISIATLEKVADGDFLLIDPLEETLFLDAKYKKDNSNTNPKPDKYISDVTAKDKNDFTLLYNFIHFILLNKVNYSENHHHLISQIDLNILAGEKSISKYFTELSNDIIKRVYSVEAMKNFRYKSRDAHEDIKLTIEEVQTFCLTLLHIVQKNLQKEKASGKSLIERDSDYYLPKTLTGSELKESGLNEKNKQNLEKYTNLKLINAIRNNDLALFSEIIKNYPSCINKQDYHTSMTPLLWATKLNRIEMINILLANGADVNFANNNKFNALHFAAEHKDASALKILLKEMARLKETNIDAVNKIINSQDERGDTPISIACELGNLDNVEALQMIGADPNICNYYRYSALAIATRSFTNFNIDTVKIVNALVNPNSKQKISPNYNEMKIAFGIIEQKKKTNGIKNMDAANQLTKILGAAILKGKNINTSNSNTPNVGVGVNVTAKPVNSTISSTSQTTVPVSFSPAMPMASIPLPLVMKPTAKTVQTPINMTPITTPITATPVPTPVVPLPTFTTVTPTPVIAPTVPTISHQVAYETKVKQLQDAINEPIYDKFIDGLVTGPGAYFKNNPFKDNGTTLSDDKEAEKNIIKNKDFRAAIQNSSKPNKKRQQEAKFAEAISNLVSGQKGKTYPSLYYVAYKLYSEAYFDNKLNHYFCAYELIKNGMINAMRSIHKNVRPIELAIDLEDTETIERILLDEFKENPKEGISFTHNNRVWDALAYAVEKGKPFAAQIIFNFYKQFSIKTEKNDPVKLAEERKKQILEANPAYRELAEFYLEEQYKFEKTPQANFSINLENLLRDLADSCPDKVNNVNGLFTNEEYLIIQKGISGLNKEKPKDIKNKFKRAMINQHKYNKMTNAYLHEENVYNEDKQQKKQVIENSKHHRQETLSKIALPNCITPAPMIAKHATSEEEKIIASGKLLTVSSVKKINPNKTVSTPAENDENFFASYPSPTNAITPMHANTAKSVVNIDIVKAGNTNLINQKDVYTTPHLAAFKINRGETPYVFVGKNGMKTIYRVYHETIEKENEPTEYRKVHTFDYYQDDRLISSYTLENNLEQEIFIGDNVKISWYQLILFLRRLKGPHGEDSPYEHVLSFVKDLQKTNDKITADEVLTKVLNAYRAISKNVHNAEFKSSKDIHFGNSHEAVTFTKNEQAFVPDNLDKNDEDILMISISTGDLNTFKAKIKEIKPHKKQLKTVFAKAIDHKQLEIVTYLLRYGVYPAENKRIIYDQIALMCSTYPLPINDATYLNKMKELLKLLLYHGGRSELFKESFEGNTDENEIQHIAYAVNIEDMPKPGWQTKFNEIEVINSILPVLALYDDPDLNKLIVHSMNRVLPTLFTLSKKYYLKNIHELVAEKLKLTVTEKRIGANKIIEENKYSTELTDNHIEELKLKLLDPNNKTTVDENSTLLSYAIKENNMHIFDNILNYHCTVDRQAYMYCVCAALKNGNRDQVLKLLNACEALTNIKLSEILSYEEASNFKQPAALIWNPALTNMPDREVIKLLVSNMTGSADLVKLLMLSGANHYELQPIFLEKLLEKHVTFDANVPAHYINKPKYIIDFLRDEIFTAPKNSDAILVIFKYLINYLVTLESKESTSTSTQNTIIEKFTEDLFNLILKNNNKIANINKLKTSVIGKLFNTLLMENEDPYLSEAAKKHLLKSLSQNKNIASMFLSNETDTNVTNLFLNLSNKLNIETNTISPEKMYSLLLTAVQNNATDPIKNIFGKSTEIINQFNIQKWELLFAHALVGGNETVINLLFAQFYANPAYINSDEFRKHSIIGLIHKIISIDIKDSSQFNEKFINGINAFLNNGISITENSSSILAACLQYLKPEILTGKPWALKIFETLYMHPKINVTQKHMYLNTFSFDTILHAIPLKYLTPQIINKYIQQGGDINAINDLNKTILDTISMNTGDKITNIKKPIDAKNEFSITQSYKGSPYFSDEEIKSLKLISEGLQKAGAKVSNKIDPLMLKPTIFILAVKSEDNNTRYYTLVDQNNSILLNLESTGWLKKIQKKNIKTQDLYPTNSSADITYLSLKEMRGNILKHYYPSIPENIGLKEIDVTKHDFGGNFDDKSRKLIDIALHRFDVISGVSKFHDPNINNTLATDLKTANDIIVGILQNDVEKFKSITAQFDMGLLNLYFCHKANSLPINYYSKVKSNPVRLMITLNRKEMLMYLLDKDKINYKPTVDDVIFAIKNLKFKAAIEILKNLSRHNLLTDTALETLRITITKSRFLSTWNSQVDLSQHDAFKLLAINRDGEVDDLIDFLRKNTKLSETKLNNLFTFLERHVGYYNEKVCELNKKFGITDHGDNQNLETTKVEANSNQNLKRLRVNDPVDEDEEEQPLEKKSKPTATKRALTTDDASNTNKKQKTAPINFNFNPNNIPKDNSNSNSNVADKNRFFTTNISNGNDTNKTNNGPKKP